MAGRYHLSCIKSLLFGIGLGGAKGKLIFLVPKVENIADCLSLTFIYSGNIWASVNLSGLILVLGIQWWMRLFATNMSLPFFPFPDFVVSVFITVSLSCRWWKNYGFCWDKEKGRFYSYFSLSRKNINNKYSWVSRLIWFYSREVTLVFVICEETTMHVTDIT